MPPVTPTRIRATGTLCRWRSHLSAKRTSGTALGKPGGFPGATCLHRSTTRRVVRERELAPGDLLHRHRQVVLRSGLDERRGRVLQPESLSELVVVVVDLTGPLRGHDHERVPRRRIDVRGGVREELVDAGFDHRCAMVPASCRELTFDDRGEHLARPRDVVVAHHVAEAVRLLELQRASVMRSSISPVDSVARSRSRRSSSSTSAEMKIVHAPGTSAWTCSAPSSSSSRTQTRPCPAIRSISDRSVPYRLCETYSTHSRKSPSSTRAANSSSSGTSTRARSPRPAAAAASSRRSRPRAAAPARSARGSASPSPPPTAR